jgi:hypothetical protein
LTDSDNTQSERGNNISYLTDRIRSQHPDVFEALQRGEYTSVRAAAVDAGIRPKIAQHVATVEGFARSAKKHLSEAQVEELIKALTGDE